jgi:hypothetical protein
MDFVGARPPQSFTVPFFSQRDPRWKDHPLRTTGACTLSTIGTGGCTLTSATMVFRFYGAQQTSTGGTMNPPNVSDCMGTSACPFNWDRGEVCSDGHAALVARTGFDWGRLDREINQNHRPVIVKLSNKTNSNDTHWVVVVSGYGSDPRNYRIHDPWFVDGANMLLSTRTTDYDLTGMAVYARQQMDQPGDALVGGVDDDAAAAIPKSDAYETAGSYSVERLANTIPVSGTILVRSMTEVTMTVQLIAESSQGNVEEMLVWTDAEPNGLWEPLQTALTLTVADVVYVRYRDDLGEMSATYSDTIFPFPAPSDAGDRDLFLPAIQRNR